MNIIRWFGEAVAASRILASGLSNLDFAHGTLTPEKFRKLIMQRGAVMIRGAADPDLLDKVKDRLDEMFALYESSRTNTEHPAFRKIEKLDDFWVQLERSHIFDRTFREFSGFSFYDIIRNSGLWDLAVKAFPEYRVIESADCNSRRTAVGDLQIYFDAPIDFHVDAQYHFIRQLSINFWTPLVDCGRDAPSLQLIPIGVEETKNYLEFNEAGHIPAPDDIAYMRHFRCAKQRLDALAESHLEKKIWIPQFRKGDVLAFTNFTMHATYGTPEMTRPRTSVEIRINLESRPPETSPTTQIS